MQRPLTGESTQILLYNYFVDRASGTTPDAFTVVVSNTTKVCAYTSKLFT
jgi:hypothetical protein